MRIIVMLILVAALVGCVPREYGVRVGPERVATLVEGQTTFADVARDWGTPPNISRNSDGTTIAIYSHTTMNSSIAPNQFQTSFVTLWFDAQGRLTKYTQTTNQTTLPR